MKTNMEIYLKDYLYLGNTTLAVIHALADCGNGSTLHLGGGKLYFDAEFATSDSYYLPRYSDLPKLYTFYVKDKKDFTIDGDGAELIFEDNISAFGLFDCENITLKNFSIDYEYPCFWQAKITCVTDTYFEVETENENFNCKYDSNKKHLAFFKKGASEPCSTCTSMLADEFEAEGRSGKTSPDYFLCVNGEPNEFYPQMSKIFDVAQTDNKIRFTITSGSMPKHHEGCYLTATDHERRNNALYFYRCKSIIIQNIDMYTSPSFGIIGLLCENVTIQCVNSILKPGTDNKLAVVADMFHFVNTKGNIQIKDSVVHNLKDDCINVHSLYTRILKKINANKILVDCPYIAKKILNLYRRGDKIKTVNPVDFICNEEIYTVKNSEFCGRYCLELEFEENISKMQNGDFLTAFEYEPSLYVGDCRFGNNRGRGILAQTAGDIIIEDNTFYTPFCDILIGGCSKLYMEGTPAQNMTIRKNVFDCVTYPNSRPIAVSSSVTSDKIIYGKIIAEENIFKVSADMNIADLRFFDTVLFKDNIVEGCKNNESLYEILNCTNVLLSL